MRLGEAATEAAGISLANKTMVSGAGAGIVGWLSQVNWVGGIGALVAVIGLLANLYFQWRRDKRERRLAAADERRKEEMHQAQLAAVRGRCER